MNLNVNSFITRVNSRKQSSFLCIQWKLLVRQINKRNFQWYPGFLLCDPPPPPPPPPPPSSPELEWTLVGTLSEWLSRESSLLSYLQMAGIFGLPDLHDTETRVTRLILHTEEIYPAPVLLVPEIECKYLILRSQSKLFPFYSDILTYISGLFHKWCEDNFQTTFTCTCLLKLYITVPSVPFLYPVSRRLQNKKK